MLGIRLPLDPGDALDERLLAVRAQGREGRGVHLLPSQVMQPDIRIARILTRVKSRALGTSLRPFPFRVAPSRIERLATEVMLNQVDVALHASCTEATNEADFRTKIRGASRELGLAHLQWLEGLAVPKEYPRHHRQVRRRQLGDLTESLHVGLPAEEIDGDR